MRPIPGTITDPAVTRRTDQGSRFTGFIVTDANATIYGAYSTVEAARNEAAGLRHQGVECWTVPVENMEVE